MDSVLTKPYQYRIIECLGEGLNSCVYRAFKESNELKVKFEVALKILKSENLEALWRNEFERLARVKSRHCVVLHGWEVIDNYPALVLECVRGVNLAELVKFINLSQQDIDCIYAQAYRGITDLAHAGVFHGDLNLNNIMVDDAGTVKLVDFGIRNGGKDYLVTPKFAAPSVLMGQEPDIETDLFSLEAICLEIERGRSQISNCEEDANSGADAPLAQLAIQSLAKKVRVAMQKRESERARTNAYKLKRPFRVAYQRLAQQIGVGLICFFVSILSRGDSTFRAPLSPARLIIRTMKWVKVKVNGQDFGYAPLDISLSSARMIDLRWRGPTGNGERTLTLLPGQTKILTDKFFSPDPK